MPLLAHIEISEQLILPMAYRLALISAAVVVIAGGIVSAGRRRLPLRGVSVCLLVMAAATIIGARALYWLTHGGMHTRDFAELFQLRFRGFALYGGLVAAGAAGFGMCRRLQLNPWMLMDSLTPALAVGLALMRVGCFLNGCCFGHATELPWGVVYPAGSPVHAHQISQDVGLLFGGVEPVHPTQLYELAAALAAAAIAGAILICRTRPGVAFLSSAIAFSAFRLFNETLRAQTEALAVGTSFYPLVYVAVIVVSSLLFFGIAASESGWWARTSRAAGRTFQSGTFP